MPNLRAQTRASPQHCCHLQNLVLVLFTRRCCSRFKGLGLLFHQACPRSPPLDRQVVTSAASTGNKGAKMGNTSTADACDVASTPEVDGVCAWPLPWQLSRGDDGSCIFF